MHPSHLLHTEGVNVASSKGALKNASKPLLWTHLLSVCAFHCALSCLHSPKSCRPWKGSSCPKAWGSLLLWLHGTALLYPGYRPSPLFCQTGTSVSWCGTHWATPEPAGCWGGTQKNPVPSAVWAGGAQLMQLGGGKHLTVITLHCCWGEGTSAATKDVVHLTPLASSHVLGIVSHLAAFCSYLTEMHPFEKIQSLEIACHAMNHCKSSMSKTLVLINLCFSVYAVHFPLWLKPRGWNYFPK